MKKVLIIANAFPPYHLVGRLRTTQFAKYLPENGWEPVILTPTSTYLWEKDDAVLDEIPKGLKIYRAYLPPSLPVIIKNLTSSKNRPPRKETKSSQQEKKVEAKPFKNVNLKKILINCINGFQKFLNTYILIPGYHILWIPFATKRAIQIIKKEQISVIFTSFPAYSLNIIGYMLKVVTRVPWVADYRDLWTDDLSRDWLPRWRKRLERFLEFVVMKRADRIIIVSGQMVHIMLRNFPYLNNERFAVISNGFDPEYSKIIITNYKKGTSFKIVYTGQIKNFTHSKFFFAVDELIKKNDDLAKKIEIILVGRIVETEKEKIFQELNKQNIISRLHITGWISHAKALEIQKNSDVLLLIIGSKVPNPETILTGKIFEYIIAQRPILALVPEGAAKEVILKTRTGIPVHPENLKGIKNAITELYKQWKSDSLFIQPDWTEINKYDRKNLTKKLAAILDVILNKK